MCSVTGETSISTAPTAPPADRELICIYMPAQCKSVGLWYNYIQLYNSFSAIHVRMIELKNNKHNTYYRCTYLYIVNTVIFKLLLTS